MSYCKGVAAALAGFGMFVAAGEAGAASLGGGDIARIFPGQFEAKVKGYRVFFTGTKGGKLNGVAYGQQDSGRWFVKGTSLCVTFTRWTKGEAKCGTISQQGGWFVASSGEGEVLKFRRAEVAQK